LAFCFYRYAALLGLSVTLKREKKKEERLNTAALKKKEERSKIEN